MLDPRCRHHASSCPRRHEAGADGTSAPRGVPQGSGSVVEHRSPNRRLGLSPSGPASHVWYVHERAPSRRLPVFRWCLPRHRKHPMEEGTVTELVPPRHRPPGKVAAKSGNPMSRFFASIRFFIRHRSSTNCARSSAPPAAKTTTPLVVIVFVTFMMAMVSGWTSGFKLVGLVLGPDRPAHPHIRTPTVSKEGSPVSDQWTTDETDETLVVDSFIVDLPTAAVVRARPPRRVGSQSRASAQPTPTLPSVATPAAGRWNDEADVDETVEGVDRVRRADCRHAEPAVDPIKASRDDLASKFATGTSSTCMPATRTA